MENTKPEPCRIWKLVPVRVDNLARQPSLSSFATLRDTIDPADEENVGVNCCTCSHLAAEPSDGGFGTTVVEVTTVTTRKKYRLED